MTDQQPWSQPNYSRPDQQPQPQPPVYPQAAQPPVYPQAAAQPQYGGQPTYGGQPQYPQHYEQPREQLPMYVASPHLPYGQPMVVAPKNPGLSVLASFFLPGLGSIINGDVGKGIGIMVGYFVCWATFWMVLPLVGCLGFWIWGMVDANTGARDWNTRHGIIS